MRPATLALLLAALLLPAAPPAATAQDGAAQLSTTLTTAPANLDMPEAYRLRISAAGPGLSAVGPVSDTLPPGAVFNDVRLPRVSLGAASVTVGEAAGVATATVALDRANPYRAISVAYATGGGTAGPGADYEPVTGVLTFPPGIARRMISIPIVDDRADEPDELLEIRLSAPDGALLGITTAASIHIADNDGPPQRISLPLVGGRAP